MPVKYITIVSLAIYENPLKLLTLYDGKCKTNKHILCSYTTDIPPYILSYDYDRNHIIVKQSPQYKEYAIYDRINYPLGKNHTYYWIIIKRNKEVIGPLSYEDFIKKKQIYNVPDKLKFKNRICNH